MTRSLVVTLLITGCANHVAAREPAPALVPPGDELGAPRLARYHMQRHFQDLRLIESLLIANKLDEGTTLASLLVGRAGDPDTAPWQVEAARFDEAIVSLTHAPAIDEALRREAQVAGECAECHARARSSLWLPPIAAAPTDAGTVDARMQRHAWATDRLWEGMIGAAEDRWRAGLEVLAATPAPNTPVAAQQLQAIAHEQLVERSSTSLDDRVRAYGELLVSCAACHATLRVRVP